MVHRSNSQGICGMLLGCFLPRLGVAQHNYEIQVYTSDDPGHEGWLHDFEEDICDHDLDDGIQKKASV